MDLGEAAPLRSRPAQSVLVSALLLGVLSAVFPEAETRVTGKSGQQTARTHVSAIHGQPHDTLSSSTYPIYIAGVFDQEQRSLIF